MTTDDIRNLQARLVRIGDLDAAHRVGVLLAAFEDACWDMECVRGGTQAEWAADYLDAAEKAAAGEA